MFWIKCKGVDMLHRSTLSTFYFKFSLFERFEMLSANINWHVQHVNTVALKHKTTLWKISSGNFNWNLYVQHVKTFALKQKKTFRNVLEKIELKLKLYNWYLQNVNTFAVKHVKPFQKFQAEILIESSRFGDFYIYDMCIC